MTKIFHTSRVIIKGKISSPGATLLDTGSGNCYIDTEFAERNGLAYKKTKKSRVGFGGKSKKRYGSFNATFIVKSNGKTYRGVGKTYVMNLPETFSIVISGNLIKKMKLPVHKIKEISEEY